VVDIAGDTIVVDTAVDIIVVMEGEKSSGESLMIQHIIESYILSYYSLINAT